MHIIEINICLFYVDFNPYNCQHKSLNLTDYFVPFYLSSPFKSGVSMASRLCKAAMLSRFNLLASEAKKDDVLEASTYHAAKVSP